MSDPRRRHSWVLLALGVFSMALCFPPLSRFQGLFRVPQSIQSVLVDLAKPFRTWTLSSGDSLDQSSFPTLQSLFERESLAALPKLPELQAKRAFFVSVLSRDWKQNQLVLHGGSEQGIEPGMAAVWGDYFVGIVHQVERSSCVLKLPSDVGFRVAARTEQTRFVVIGGRERRLRIELPEQRSFEKGEEVWVDLSSVRAREASAGRMSVWDQGMEAAQGAILGAVQERGAHSGSFVQWAIQAEQVQGLWLLRAGGPVRPVVNLLPSLTQEKVALQWVGSDLSPRSALLQLRVLGPTEHLRVGDPVVFGQALVGQVARIEGSLLWARRIKANAPGIESLFFGDEGAIRYFGKNLEIDGLPDSPLSGSGWILTGSGDPRTPKGLILGRVRKAEAQDARPIIDSEQGFLSSPGPQRVLHVLAVKP